VGTEPEVPRNGADGPALAVQRPALLVQLLSTRLALGRAPLVERGGSRECYRHCSLPRRERHGLLTQYGIDHIKALPMRSEHLVQSFG
jgi:hypothetical protein